MDYNTNWNRPVLRIWSVLVQTTMKMDRHVASCSASLANKINICETHTHVFQIYTMQECYPSSHCFKDNVRSFLNYGLLALSVAHPVCHFTFTACLVYVSTLCTIGFCFCVCRYGFSCVYCIVFHSMDSPQSSLWFTVISCAIWSIDQKVLLNLIWIG